MKAQVSLSSSFILPPSSFFAVLQQATAALADTDFPRLTAEVLLARLLGLTRAQLLSRPEQTIPAQTLSQFERLIARAAAGEPLAYLSGHRDFCGLDFVVDAHVLVPRPETELLVDLALRFTAELAENAKGENESPLNSAHSPLSAVGKPGPHMLDVGTGSGCIAIALAVHCPSAHVTALDISSEALAVARRNAQRHAVADRIAFLQSDLLSAFGLRPSGFDLLCTNLPYITTNELLTLPVAKHEPALALDGGPDGLDLIRRLLADAPRVMAPQGRLLLEIGAAQGESAAALVHAAFPSGKVGVHKDFAGLDRVVEIAL